MWIPIVFIAVLVWAIVGAHNGIQTAGFQAQANRDKTKREAFEALMRPSDKLRWEVSKELKDDDARGRIVSEFMADGDPDWVAFSRGSFDPARMILFAQQGKMDWWDAIHGVHTPSVTISTGPWKLHTMMEKFMLHIEDTLRGNGINAILVANYKPTDVHNGGYTYYPVRDYVKCYGYAREGYIDFGTTFGWSEAVGHNYQPNLDR